MMQNGVTDRQTDTAFYSLQDYKIVTLFHTISKGNVYSDICVDITDSGQSSVSLSLYRAGMQSTVYT